MRAGFRVHGLGFRVQGLGFRDYRVEGSGIASLGIKVLLGFRYHRAYACIFTVDTQ